MDGGGAGNTAPYIRPEHDEAGKGSLNFRPEAQLEEQHDPTVKVAGSKPVRTSTYEEGTILDTSQIAEVAHEINRAYCASLGDFSQVPWDSAPDWQKSSAIAGVEFHWNNLSASPEDSHNSWLAVKAAEGWKWGPVKDPVLKEHPCFTEYENLPQEQRSKDYLFRAVVHSLIRYMDRAY